MCRYLTVATYKHFPSYSLQRRLGLDTNLSLSCNPESCQLARANYMLTLHVLS